MFCRTQLNCNGNLVCAMCGVEQACWSAGALPAAVISSGCSGDVCARCQLIMSIVSWLQHLGLLFRSLDSCASVCQLFFRNGLLLTACSCCVNVVRPALAWRVAGW
jgi:hypothetical protein